MSNTIKYLFVGSVLGLSLAAGGCVVRGGVGYESPGYYQEPTLVAVQPGVWVIADYNEPVFYSDNYYWAYRGGYWYRSSIYTGGWVRVHAVPHRIRGIRHPHSYAHYHVPPRAQTRRAPRAGVRDHRAYRSNRGYPPPRANTRVPAQRGGTYRAPASRSRPGVRDNRRVQPKKSAPPRKSHKSKSKSKSRSRDHR